MAGKILVLGATGTIGSKVAAGLVAKGEKVKAVSRGATAVAGAEAVALDLANPAALDAALEGVDRVFANVPAGYLDPVGLLSPVIEAAAAREAARKARFSSSESLMQTGTITYVFTLE